MQFVRICSVKDCHIFTDIILLYIKISFKRIWNLNTLRAFFLSNKEGDADEFKSIW